MNDVLNDVFKVIIEIPKGMVNEKWEYDESTKEFKMDFVFSAKGAVPASSWGSLPVRQAGASGGENVVWPYNYGFFPGTRAGDGDTLDAIALSTLPLKQGQEVECKIIGMMDVLDRGEEDNKIICVPIDDPLSASVDDITDVLEAQKTEWTEFLLELARQKKKITEIKGFKNKKEALELLRKSLTKL